MMTDREEQILGERMKRIENRLASLEQRVDGLSSMAPQIQEIHRVLIGDLRNPGGMDRRLSDAEKEVTEHGTRLGRVENRVDSVERTIADVQAQGRLLNWLAGGGGIAGAIALLVKLIEAFGGG